MGCCLSTTSKIPKTNNTDVNPVNHHQHFHESEVKGGAPPPPPPPAFEEETVKEVLSETPIPKPPTPVMLIDNHKRQQPQVEEVKIEPVVSIKTAEEIVSEVSEVSEMWSFSESFSTTTLTDKKDDDDGEVTQRVQRSPVKIPRKRPYTNELAGRKERGVRTPSRRSVPSPEKRGQLPSRSIPGRTMTNQRRNLGPPNVSLRNPAEGSNRKSKSPMTREEAGPRGNLRHKSPTLFTAGRSGGQSPVRTVENEGKLDEPHDGDLPEKSESLENPLVSLECFIFL